MTERVTALDLLHRYDLWFVSTIRQITEKTVEPQNDDDPPSFSVEEKGSPYVCVGAWNKIVPHEQNEQIISVWGVSPNLVAPHVFEVSPDAVFEIKFYEPYTRKEGTGFRPFADPFALERTINGFVEIIAERLLSDFSSVPVADLWHGIKKNMGFSDQVLFEVIGNKVAERLYPHPPIHDEDNDYDPDN